MGTDELRHSDLESRNPAGYMPVQKARINGSLRRPFSTRSSRTRKFGSEASDENDTDSWSTESMRGHLFLVRNSTMAAASVVAQRRLEARLYDLSRERYEFLRSIDRDRELFLRRLRMKGGRFCDMVTDVEAKRRRSRSRRNGLHAISELNRSRRGVGGDSLTMRDHSLSFLTIGGDDKTQLQDAEDAEEEDEEEEEEEERKAAILTDDENLASMTVDIRRYGIQSAQRYNSHRHLDDRPVMRSFSALPVTRRGHRKDGFPTKGSSIIRNGCFVPASTARQPSKSQSDEFGFDEYADRPKCCVFSDVCQRSLMSEIPECVQVTKLIDEIDSLHLPPRIQKKAKPKSDAVLRDIFRL